MADYKGLLDRAERATGEEREALLRAAGKAVGRQIQARIAAGHSRNAPAKRGNRRAGKRKHQVIDYPDVWRGGMVELEYVVGERARDDAIRAERELWLPQLERWHATADEPERMFLAKEIRRLHRCLGIRPDPATVRAQTRDRVRRHRARRRRGPAPRPR
jgi:hypothetical protein